MKPTRALFLLLLVAACKTNPYTGRKQLLAMSEQREIELGQEAWKAELREAQVEYDVELIAPLRRVGKAIAHEADTWRREQAQREGKEPIPYDWTFVLIRDQQINAWALPGGKIAFYTGIYPVLQDEAGMAIVMGHEVMHAMLRHGAERMSQKGTQVGGVILAGIVAPATIAAMIAFGLGTKYGVLMPYSRKQETEADEHGLMLAARAGYDPEAALAVWQRMAAISSSKTPAFLSTHPDTLKRIENMKKWMPRAKALYEQSRKQPDAPLPSVSAR